MRWGFMGSCRLTRLRHTLWSEKHAGWKPREYSWMPVCKIVPNTNLLSLWSFYWPCLQFPHCVQLFPLWKHALLAVSWRCHRLCSRFNYHPVIAFKSERSSGMHRQDNCQDSLQTPSAPSTPQTRKGGGRVNMWHHSVSWALRHSSFCCQIPSRCVKCVQTGMTVWRQFSAICQILASPPPAPILVPHDFLKDKYRH